MGIFKPSAVRISNVIFFTVFTAHKLWLQSWRDIKCFQECSQRHLLNPKKSEQISFQLFRFDAMYMKLVFCKRLTEPVQFNDFLAYKVV